MPNAYEAFNTLVTLLQGRATQFRDGDGVRNDDKEAVFSAWRWSICLNSLTCRDPSEIRPGFAVPHGVPMRNGVRKRLMLDGFIASGSGPQARESEKKREQKSTDKKIVARPGDEISVQSSRTISQKTKNLIAVTDTAFEVAQVYTFEPLSDEVAVNASHLETKSEKWDSGQCRIPTGEYCICRRANMPFMWAGLLHCHQNLGLFRGLTNHCRR